MKLGVLFLIVFSAIIYSWSVYLNSAPAGVADLSIPEAVEGKLVWQKHNCSSCHQIYGLGGYMGPDLTNIMSAKGRGEMYVRALLKTGTARMPNFHLEETEIDALAAYLHAVDSSGKYPLQRHRINFWGNFALANE